MDVNELDPVKKKKQVKNLEEMSIEALEEYIVDLELEIKRVENTIVLKKSAREGASSFFKS